MTITIVSFGFRRGVPEEHVLAQKPRPTRLVDARDMRNPHKLASLRELTGKDKDVQDYVERDPKFEGKLNAMVTELADNEVVFIGCFGGRHRSVALAEAAARFLRVRGTEVAVVHRELASAAE